MKSGKNLINWKKERGNNTYFLNNIYNFATLKRENITKSHILFKYLFLFLIIILYLFKKVIFSIRKILINSF